MFWMWGAFKTLKTVMSVAVLSSQKYAFCLALENRAPKLAKVTVLQPLSLLALNITVVWCWCHL